MPRWLELVGSAGVLAGAVAAPAAANERTPAELMRQVSEIVVCAGHAPAGAMGIQGVAMAARGDPLACPVTQAPAIVLPARGPVGGAGDISVVPPLVTLPPPVVPVAPTIVTAPVVVPAPPPVGGVGGVGLIPVAPAVPTSSGGVGGIGLR